MELEDKFNTEIKKWEDYCGSWEIQLSSNISDLFESCSYLKLLKMGKEILPFINRLYHEPIGKNSAHGTMILHGFPGLIGEIVGDEYKIPKKIEGKVYEIKTYTINWLSDYLKKSRKNP